MVHRIPMASLRMDEGQLIIRDCKRLLHQATRLVYGGYRAPRCRVSYTRGRRQGGALIRRQGSQHNHLHLKLVYVLLLSPPCLDLDYIHCHGYLTALAGAESLAHAVSEGRGSRNLVNPFSEGFHDARDSPRAGTDIVVCGGVMVTGLTDDEG